MFCVRVVHILEKIGLLLMDGCWVLMDVRIVVSLLRKRDIESISLRRVKVLRRGSNLKKI